MFKVNNRNTRTKCEICSKLTTKTLERRQRCLYCSGIVIVNFERILFFEQVNARWVHTALMSYFLKFVFNVSMCIVFVDIVDCNTSSAIEMCSSHKSTDQRKSSLAKFERIKESLSIVFVGSSRPSAKYLNKVLIKPNINQN